MAPKWTAEDLETQLRRRQDGAISQGALPVRYQDFSHLIGIDTGVKTGFALYDRATKRLKVVKTLHIHQAFDLVQETLLYSRGLFLRVEDARKRKFIPKMENEKAERGRALGAGYVKRDAVIWEDYLMDLSKKVRQPFGFEMVAPKDNVTKMSADRFQLITKYTMSTTEHGRDAAFLVFGF